MSSLMVARLWVMVFLHYFVWSAWYATLGSYLEKLQFSGDQIGLAYGTTAIGAMASPFVAGVLADRFFATQRLLAMLHLGGAALLLLISQLTGFGLFYPILIAYTVSYMAGHGLTNTLTLHHSTNPAREFPIVMMGGSVGWICAGLLVSFLKIENSSSIFLLASGAALVMGLYSLSLPHTPPRGAGPISFRTAFGLDALKLMKDRSFAVFIICSFLVCIPLSFYFTWISVFMGKMGIAQPAAKMTIGQVSDVVFLLLLPFLLPRLGAKGILILGMSAWAVRFGLFALFAQQPASLWPLLYLGIAIHGMCYDYIFVMGRMYVDARTTEENRGAAQGLHAMVTLGAGMFIGTWLAGSVGEHFATKVDKSVIHDWRSIWLVPAGLAVVLIPLFAVLFRESPAPEPAAAAEPVS